MSAIRFSDHLRALAEPIWAAQHAHPFVRGIGDGTLSADRFAHWLRQDYRFLIEYCRLFGLAAARAPDLATLARFADLLQATARGEMENTLPSSGASTRTRPGLASIVVSVRLVKTESWSYFRR